MAKQIRIYLTQKNMDYLVHIEGLEDKSIVSPFSTKNQLHNYLLALGMNKFIEEEIKD